MQILDRNSALKSDVACALGNLVFNSEDKSSEVMPMLKKLFHDEDCFLRQDGGGHRQPRPTSPELVEDEIEGLKAMLDSDDGTSGKPAPRPWARSASTHRVVRTAFPNWWKSSRARQGSQLRGIISAFGALGYHYPEMVPLERIPRLVGCTCTALTRWL